MDPLLLLAATVVTDESRAAFAALGQPPARPTVHKRSTFGAFALALTRPVRRAAAAAA